MSDLNVPEFKICEEDAAFRDNGRAADTVEDDGKWFRFEMPARQAMRVAIVMTNQ